MEKTNFRAIEVNPSCNLLTDSGLLHFRRGDYLQAIDRFTRALENSSNKIQLYRYLGEANRRIQDYKGMAQWFQKVVNFYPNDLDGWQNLAIAYEALGMKTMLAKAHRRINRINGRE